MKSIALIALLVTLSISCYRSSDIPVSVDPGGWQLSKDIVTRTGYGTVVGYQGELRVSYRPGGPMYPLPQGYMISDPTWEQGAPDSLHARVYLYGKESELAKAIRVRATGGWAAITRKVGTETYHFINLTIDRLEVLASYGTQEESQ